MRSVYRMFILAGLSGVAGLWAVTAQAQDQARILRVEHATVSGSAGRTASLYSPRISKFADLNEGVPREVYTVYWLPPSRGTPSGTLVTFEYRQERSPDIKFLYIKYPFLAQGERKATFEIAENARRVGGGVTAWRVRVVHGGRLLAEQTSDTWR
ncbi:MAG: hypothetical protein V1873_03695 [Verrucomicrobiota bacterium]